MSTETENLIELFKSIGLDEKKSHETLKNKKLSNNLNKVIYEAGVSKGTGKNVGSLLYLLASTCNKDNEEYLPFISKYIASGDLRMDSQVTAALNYIVKQHNRSIPMDIKSFESACGIGIIVTIDDIKRSINTILEKNHSDLLEERYGFNQGQLLKEIKEEPNMKWAEGKLIKDQLDSALEILLGPKTEEDKLLKPKKKATPSSSLDHSKEMSKSTDSCEVNDTCSSPYTPTRLFEGEVLKFHKPGQNAQLNDEILQKHLKATGGKVVTRFPPEPNGFLHIGHAKAINFNFRYASTQNGITYLRYDDTNPEAEEEIYFKAIKENVEWLGFEPYKVTHSSDYFQQLYEYAVQLIKSGDAYVCHQTPEEIFASRGGADKGLRTESPWRNRPIEESLRLFEDMKNGKCKEGEMTLRLKMDMNSSNPFMWDLVAYRVLYTPHVRTGKQWCIYPMYDFTHCLCDSIENITHSLCTTEFILAREAYYWVCDKVKVYKPVQWEYGRLSITNTILSKRKLTKLVSEGIVKGWDDPRLYTLAGIRRRGFTPRAVNNFVEKLGITTAFSVIDVHLLESCVREDLNEVAPRRMAVLDPVVIIIENLHEDYCEMISLSDIPHQPSSPLQSVPFTRKIFIDRSDFKPKNDDPNFYRLTPGQPVGLYKAHVIECTGFEMNKETGLITQIKARVLPATGAGAVKPQTFIQWVADSPAHASPVVAEVRLYGDLFKSRNPNDAPNGWMSDVAPDSLTVVSNAFVDIRVKDAKVEEKFQFQRVGYFCIDADSSPTGMPKRKLVFNRTVTLKEDPCKTS